jgi:uncharacterized protein YdeI (YjbR/CyaY-like superfamily)
VSERHPHLELTDRAGLRAWLAAHHADALGVWAVTFRKAAAPEDGYVAYEEIVEEALCFGWIDSVRRSVDDSRSRLLLTPRKRGSGWSRVNKGRIARLRAAGLMQPAGEAAIAAAVADGSWAKLDLVEDLAEPEDLRAALDAAPGAREHWDGFPRSAKRGILEWIGNARRPATRSARVAETAAAAARGERANQWRRKGG